MTPGVSADVAALADRVRSAHANGAPLRVTGAGTWLDGGQPCIAADHLELAALTGIVAYEPGDLTLTVLAATPLSAIQALTASEGQWLTMDPHGSPDGTIGATVSTASSGPLASAYGTPRDHVLGCEFVTGIGDVVRGGGRVVKNVAGFDLVRLVTGAWGTLGAITEITVRLRAKPEQDVTLAVATLSGAVADVTNGVREWSRSIAFRPLAMELLSPSLARRLTGHSEELLLVRIGGNSTHARAAVDAVSSLGTARDIGHGVWSQLAQTEPKGALVFRVSALPSRIGSLFSTASALAEELGGYAHATVTRGIVRCVVPPPSEPQAVDYLCGQLSALSRNVTVAGERMSAPLWAAVRRLRSTDALSLRVRSTFDPGRILNPGILGDA